jgi:hypothetical protein
VEEETKPVGFEVGYNSTDYTASYPRRRYSSKD